MPQLGPEDIAARLVTVGPIAPSWMGKRVTLNDAVGRVASNASTQEILSGLVPKGVAHPVRVTNLVGSRAHGVAFRAPEKNDGDSVGF